MKQRSQVYLILILFLTLPVLSSCTLLKRGPVELSKVLWGSSTRALEEARTDALKAQYQCDSGEAFQKVLDIAKDNDYTIFIKDKRRNLIVLMGIPNSINTTEVGIFFSPLGNHQTRLEITSLSSNAKRAVSQVLFPAFAESYEEAQ